MRRVVIVVVAAGCGRIAFDPIGDAARAAFHKTITIDHTKVAADLADFPVLIELHDSEVAARAAPDGHDIQLADSTGTLLAYEREVYSAAPPLVIAWVKVPLLAAATDTVLDLGYGDPALPDQARPVETWSNHFASVYHFGDGTTLGLADATGRSPATNAGASATAGKIAGGFHVDNATASSANRVTSAAAGLDMSAGALNTVTFWVNYTGAPGKGMFAFTSATGAVYDLWNESDGCFGFNTEGGGNLASTQSGLGNAWHYIAAVFFNGIPEPGPNKLYIDGVAQSLVTSCGGMPTNARTVGGTADWGGNTEGGTMFYEMTGDLDEGRLTAGERSAAWFATEFANQSSPAAFVTVGPEQIRGVAR